tara:strand:- start:338 stop:850 length:513 start_codon:yes stop_codon:yes gene_type:complete
MTEPSPIEIFEQAKAMGLKLSADGKSWIPAEELVVRKPPSMVVKPNQDSVLRISQLTIFTTLGAICFVLFIIGIFEVGLFALLPLFLALFFLTPIFFHLTRPEENTGSNVVGIGHPIILNQQVLHRQTEQRVMGIFGTISMIILLITIISIIIMLILIFILIGNFIDFIS